VYKMVLFVIWLVALVGADLDWMAIWSSVIEHNVALWMPVLLLISKGGLLPLN
jgi:hypothetical protein